MKEYKNAYGDVVWSEDGVGAEYTVTGKSVSGIKETCPNLVSGCTATRCSY